MKSSPKKNGRNSAPPRKASRLIFILLFFCLLPAVFVLGRWETQGSIKRFAAEPQPETVQGHPGPWGQLEYVRISISPPEEMLSVQSLESQVTHWIFKDYTRDTFAKFLDTLNLPADQRASLLDPQRLQVTANGLDLTLPTDVFLALSDKARLQLYQVLARFPENNAHLWFVPVKQYEEDFAGSGVSEATLNLFQKVSCHYHDYILFSHLPGIIASLPSYDEKLRVLKALNRHATLLVRLRITPDSDLPAMEKYWSRAHGGKNLAPFFESLKRLPGGARVDMTQLLPPLPTALLYTFPLPSGSSIFTKGNEECLWTSFNFFNFPANTNFSNPSILEQTLHSDYVDVTSTSPQYGDIVFFQRADGTVVHAAVYLADDIVYTKNGSSNLHPWILSTIPELQDLYSFQLGPNEKLDIKFFRNKNY